MTHGLVSGILAFIVHAGVSTPPKPSCFESRSATVTPTHGPVGTRIRFRARCFHRDDMPGKEDGYGVFLLNDFTSPRECEVLAVRDEHFRVSRRHVLRGSFVVPRRGGCFQHTYGRRITPDRYDVNFGCHPCNLATFTVTRGP